MSSNRWFNTNNEWPFLSYRRVTLQQSWLRDGLKGLKTWKKTLLCRKPKFVTAEILAYLQDQLMVLYLSELFWFKFLLQCFKCCLNLFRDKPPHTLLMGKFRIDFLMWMPEGFSFFFFCRSQDWPLSWCREYSFP